MKFTRLVTDVVMFLLLIGVLLWGCLLFSGAYSQHRISMFVTQNALQNVEQDIKNIIQATNQGNPNPKIDLNQQIQNLKDVQLELFDKNTVSFQYQFLQMVMIVIGLGIMRYIQSTDKQRLEVVENAQRRCDDMRNNLTKIENAKSSTTTLAMHFTRLHTFSQFYCLFEDPKQKEKLRLMMSDFLNDANGQLEKAWLAGEGFEENLFINVALDSADKFNENIIMILRGMEESYEQISMKRICDISSYTLDFMQVNGKNFTKRFDDQWNEIVRNDEVLKVCSLPTQSLLDKKYLKECSRM